MTVRENPDRDPGDALARRGVPWWGAATAAAAPLLLVTGLTMAAELQPPGFAVLARTVSSLAGQGAADSWIMTITFAFVGACDMVTSLALRPAARAGRLMLAGAGLAGMLVAAFPEHPGGSRVHAMWAGIGFAGLILWPVLAMRRHGGSEVPWALRPASCVPVTVVMSLLTLWFATEQAGGGAATGLAESMAGLAQTIWPLIVIISCRRARGSESAADLTAGLDDPGPFSR